MASKTKIVVEYKNIAEIKPNQKNPRVIKDEKYRQLCDSLRNFPDMLEKRPLVCFTDIDGKFTVLGGNMRLKAATELGMKELPVMLADTWTEEQKAEFLIKDNVGFGEWNWQDLQTDWDVQQLEDWGLEVPKWAEGSDLNNMDENDLDLTEDFDPVGVAKDCQRVVFIFKTADEAQTYLENNKIEFVKRNMAWQVNMNIPSI